MKSDINYRLFTWVAAGMALAALNTGLAPAPTGKSDSNSRANWIVALGGSQALAADLAWLRAYQAWRQRDAMRTEALIRATVALDGRPDVFWVNGARIIAHDFAAWEMDAEPLAPAAVVADRRARFARRAVEFLEEAGHRRKPSPGVLLEAASIQLHVLNDLEAAAVNYRAAALLPGAPWHAGRMHARLRVRLGRTDDAIRWLLDWLPKLPDDEPAAQKELVRQWLAELEREAVKQ